MSFKNIVRHAAGAICRSCCTHPTWKSFPKKVRKHLHSLRRKLFLMWSI